MSAIDAPQTVGWLMHSWTKTETGADEHLTLEACVCVCYCCLKARRVLSYSLHTCPPRVGNPCVVHIHIKFSEVLK